MFKQKSPANLVVLLIFGVLIKMPYLLHPQVVQAAPTDGLLYPSMHAALGNGNGALYTGALTAFLLLYGQAMMINYAVNEHRLTAKHSFLPAMAYLLITSLMPEWNYFSPPLLASTLIIWAILRLFRVYNVASIKSTVFNIGLILGLSALIYFPAAAFLLLLLLGILILRPFRVNELVLLALGAITPFYFFAVYLFLSDRLTVANIFPSIYFDVPNVQQSLRLAIAAVFLVLPFIIGAFHIQNHLRKMLIQVRKNWSIVLIWLLLALLIPFVNSRDDWHNWVLAMPAFAAFHAAAYLYPTKKWVPLLLFWGTVAWVLALQYGNMPIR
ncbi:hypothetical protein SAMN05444008_12917 [Cnuella takakiae]|uniref:Beta-carotene 15,15'-monooxygenase n=1 Tax=Cnuella takakiae TaxID=1302690 RepID=A0A1M5J9X5_9BACT|nr:hypothetical protein BUE76_07405 [Cnuella takakiae]SHG37119.1 hypothetical protein SAMN05444008_12917 [Cnuella takakiae]